MKLLVLSRRGSYYSTRRLREAGNALGHEIVVVDPLRCTLLVEKGGPRVYFGARDLGDADVVIPRVGTYGADYSIAVVRQFELMGKPVLNSAESISLTKDKLKCLQMLVARGFKVPPTILSRFPQNIARAIDHLGGPPVILKLLRGSQGTGVILGESPHAVEAVLDTMWNLGQDIMLQQFVAEAEGSDFRILVLDGRILAAMRRSAKKGDFRSNIHCGGTGVKATLSREAKSIALRAAAATGLDFAGVDLLESSKGLLALEVNSSPGFQGMEDATGLDIASKLIRYAVAMAGPNRRAARSGA
ncbi:MAG: RimK family alpha-L-glutamate ligase [Planctomycetota bacterium]|nr:RimK family alpha-L-glutamate ligase [Planctomycetota bacterium]